MKVFIGKNLMQTIKKTNYEYKDCTHQAIGNHAGNEIFAGRLEENVSSARNELWVQGYF
jgi:hypothetical protein